MAFWNRRTDDDDTAQPEEKPSEGVLGKRDVRNLIEACVARRATAVVLCSDVGATYNGRFSAINNDVVHIEISSPDPLAIKVLSLCVVTFNHGTKARVFLTSLLGADRDPGSQKLLVQVPTEMAGAEGRFAFRVPVLDEGLFQVTLRHGAMEVDAQPIDLSLTGLQVEVPEGTDLGVRIDDTIQVELEHGKYRITLDAIVRRIIGRRYGLFFPASVRSGGRVEPPVTLVNLVRELEQLWLRGQREDPI